MNDLPRNGPNDPRRDEANREPAGDEPPPFGRSWNVLYAIVVLNLALLILLFYAFTRAFS